MLCFSVCCISQCLCWFSDTPEELHDISPPFGSPLSTDKLIQSAIELLSCEPSNNIYKIDSRQSNQPIKDSSNVSSLVDGVTLDCDSSTDTTRSPEPADLKLKVDESIDGDISNLSAFDDDEGWQSQERRSHRKKKRELQSRERNSSKGKKDFPKEPKQHTTFKRQNPRNSNSKTSNLKKNCAHESKSQTEEKENIEKIDKSNLEVDDSTSVSVTPKEDKENSNCGAVFSYRDALLKAKPKPTGKNSFIMFLSCHNVLVILF